jgi:hypothetical protein
MTASKMVKLALERISRRCDAWLRRKQLEINRRARIGPCDAQ